ncbi:hypothetical protein RIF23_14590 [Lipingzhangella sp. LS1_29]|uniref:Phenylacetate-CoA ligase n=1 Tax=Lipingzhangella rawalii TaxID=2055835 RepID=A0ABU2H9J6_9ACTN|nr:hypothetical protein [Lipingzhangella rawalii]MDS1271524.1 hypothetical protein [Lipingzhangella rawalii]
MSIGTAGADHVLAEARRWLGPANDPDDLQDFADLTPWTFTRMQDAARTRARSNGGLVVASGGTTGAPKLTVMAPNLGVPRLLPHWRPLGAGDVLLNLFSPGRMWGAQYFYNALSGYCQSTVAPIGSLAPKDVAEWAPTLAGLGVNAIAGAPNAVARFAEAVSANGVDLDVRTIIWAGEPMTPARSTVIHEAFPEAGLWGNYGSIETFVIGVNRPGCRTDVFHLLPDQLLEPEDEGALLSRVGEGWPAPAVRFRLGDRVEPMTCPCADGHAFRVVGRVDDQFKLCGVMLRAGDILERAVTIPGVREAQLLLYCDPADPAAVTSLQLHYTEAEREAHGVRSELVRRTDGLDILDLSVPDTVSVKRVAVLERSPRTDKVLPVLWRDALDPPNHGGHS